MIALLQVVLFRSILLDDGNTLILHGKVVKVIWKCETYVLCIIPLSRQGSKPTTLSQSERDPHNVPVKMDAQLTADNQGVYRSDFIVLNKLS